jgi:hypothetical protein
MSESEWDLETTRFLALSPEEKCQWLASLMVALTIFARGTYASSHEGVDDPQKLRQFNELFHRVADQLRNCAVGRIGRPNDIFIKMLTEAMRELDVATEGVIPYLRAK